MVHHRNTNTLYSIRNCLSGRHDIAQEITLMSANVVQFNVATQLANRCNLMDCVRRYITFCNVLTGHFTQMHNPCKLLSQSHKQIANVSLSMNTMKGHREAEFVISNTPSSRNCINEYLARDGDCNMHICE